MVGGWLVLEGDGIGSLPSGDGSSAHTNAYNHVHLIQIYTFKIVSKNINNKDNEFPVL